MTDWIVIMAPGSDIGRKITQHLLDKGYGIVGMGRSNSIDFIESLDHDQIISIECDYTDEQSIIDAFSEAKNRIKQITGCIHLVGGSLVTVPLLELNLDTLKKVMRVNFYSAYLAGREAAQWMIETGGGNIIFFGSTTGIEPSRGKLAYGVAKAAVHNLTKSFALELDQFAIFSNTIAPGYVMTDRHDRELDEKATTKKISRDELEQNLSSKNVTNRIVQTGEILDIVDLLLTTTSIQGQVLTVDLGQIGF